MNAEAAVLVEESPEIWTVTLNAPARRNALSQAVVRALAEAIERANASRTLRAVILRGAGDKAFCAGADLKERQTMSPDEVRVFLKLLNDTFTALAESPKVWIAAIQGACLGGGLELALCCDLRVAHTEAILGLPEARLGIIPGAGGTQRLPRLIGMARAKALLLTGGRIDAARAEAIGLVNAVAEDLSGSARALAEEVAQCAPFSLSQAKRAADQGWDLPMTEALAFERSCYEPTLNTRDRLEALQAFAERRAPRFTGE